MGMTLDFEGKPRASFFKDATQSYQLATPLFV